MAHFAELDENNIVLRVIVVNNDELLDENGNEIEQKGIDFCSNLLGGTWVQTSYNGKLRKRFAGIGMFYDSTQNLFRLLNKPIDYPSFILDEDGNWIPPIPYPSDAIINNENPSESKTYYWDEKTLSWVLIPYIDPLELALENTPWQ
jgi:hypothetical protein